MELHYFVYQKIFTYTSIANDAIIVIMMIIIQIIRIIINLQKFRIKNQKGMKRKKQKKFI